MTELASDTICSAKESSCACVGATAGVSGQVARLPAHSRLLILRPTRCTTVTCFSINNVISRLDVIAVISRIRPACSGDSSTVFLYPFHLSGRDTARCGYQPDASESEGDLAPFVPESVSSCIPSHLSARCPKRKVSHVINKGNYG